MAKSQVIEERKPELVEAEGPVCQHHWVIASPRGALSEGRCKRCGEEREFRNSTDYVWDNDSGSGSTPWRGIRSTPTTAVHSDDEMAASARSTGAAMLV